MSRMHAGHFQYLQGLTKLSVAHSKITDTTAAPLIAKLSELKALQVLNVSHNCLNDDFAPHPLAGTLSQLCFLTRFKGKGSARSHKHANESV
jgi:hypothetical protein